jgi:hypothetical protein
MEKEDEIGIAVDGLAAQMVDQLWTEHWTNTHCAPDVRTSKFIANTQMATINGAAGHSDDYDDLDREYSGCPAGPGTKL